MKISDMLKPRAEIHQIMHNQEDPGWSLLCTPHDDLYTDYSILNGCSKPNFPMFTGDASDPGYDHSMENFGWNLLCDIRDDIYIDSSLCKESPERYFRDIMLISGWTKAIYGGENCGWNLLCEMQDDINTDSNVSKKNSGRNFPGMVHDGDDTRDDNSCVTGWILLCEMQDEEGSRTEPSEGTATTTKKVKEDIMQFTGSSEGRRSLIHAGG